MLISLLFSVAMADPGTISESVYLALLQRDGFSCDDVQLMGDHDAVRDALIADVAVQSPPWVPMRAAGCVAAHADGDPLAWTAVRGWMGDATAPGLALVVLDSADKLPAPRAVELAELAIARMPTDARFALYAQPKIAQSLHPEVRALLK